MHPWKSKLTSHVKAWVIFRLTWASKRKKYDAWLVIWVFRDASGEENLWGPFIFSIAPQWTNAPTVSLPLGRWSLAQANDHLGGKESLCKGANWVAELFQTYGVAPLKWASEIMLIQDSKWLSIIRLWAAKPGISNGFWWASVTWVKVIPIVDGQPQGQGYYYKVERKGLDSLCDIELDGKASMNSCLAWYRWITYGESFNSMCSRICTCCPE